MSKNPRSVLRRWVPKYERAKRAFRYWHRRWRQAVVWNLSHEERGRRWNMRRQREQEMSFAKRVVDRWRRLLDDIYVVTGSTVYRSGGYGSLGPIRRVTVHHSAGSRAHTFEEARSLIRSYDQMHRHLFGGGIGYHEIYDDKGRCYQVRSPKAKGAHTGRDNSNNYGICFLDNFETREPNEAQLRALRLRVTEAPPPGLPDLRGLPVYGHRDRPGQSTACPGKNMIEHVRKL